MAPRTSRELDQLHALHEALLAGDVGAGNMLAGWLLETCPRNLRQAFPRVDQAVLFDSVERAVLSYLADPRSFHELSGSLQSFIELAARRNVLDELRTQSARRHREVAWAQERARYARANGAGPTTPHDVWPLLLAPRGPMTDEQWAQVESLFRLRPRRKRGRPPLLVRSILEAVIERLRHGDHGHDLPSHPSDRTCSRYFRDWCRSGVLNEALERLEADLRRVPR